MLHKSKTSPKLLKNSAKHFASNLQSSLVSFVVHDDREFMVAPCVALVPGVLNGDLVTIESVANTYQAWNGRPVVVDHPYSINGQSISANDPTVLSQSGIGYVWNADIDEGKLRVQVWIDVDKARKIGGDAQRVLDMVKNGEPLEVSTGYWASLRPMQGVYNGESYSAITELIIPDHLAMLPNAIGACNWGDGCGIPRAMKREVDMDESTLRRVLSDFLKKFVPNMTVTDRMDALRAIIGREMASRGDDMYWYLMDVEDNYAIVNVRDSIRRRPFTEDESGNISLSGDWEDVTRNTTYQPMTTNKGICAECAAAMQSQAEEEPESEIEDESTPESEDEQPEQEELPMEVAAQEQAVDTLKTFLEESGTTEAEIKAALEHRRNHRAQLCETIKANSALTDDDLDQTPIKVLEEMATKYAAVATEDSSVVDNENGDDASAFVRGMPERHQQRKGGPPKMRSTLLKEVV